MNKVGKPRGFYISRSPEVVRHALINGEPELELELECTSSRSRE